MDIDYCIVLPKYYIRFTAVFTNFLIYPEPQTISMQKGANN